MPKLEHIPFVLDSDTLMGILRIVPGTDDAKEFEDLLHLAKEYGNPKALYRECFIEARDGDIVRIDNVTFTSRALRKNLEPVGKVFLFIATCGVELDRVFPSKSDILKEFWWDTIKACLLKAACDFLENHLHTAFRLGKTSSMSPGSGDADTWPIEEQKPLFRLLGDVQTEIGVTLTDSCLMIPNKTVSGIRFPAERDFRTCQVCHRENCPARSAAFDPDLARTLGQA